jgi:hypothetical protein
VIRILASLDEEEVRYMQVHADNLKQTPERFKFFFFLLPLFFLNLLLLIPSFLLLFMLLVCFLFSSPLYSQVLHHVSFYALDLYLNRAKHQSSKCSGVFSATTGIICPCKLEELKKKKRIGARGVLPLQTAHFDPVYHLHGLHDMSPSTVNVLAALSVQSSSSAAGVFLFIFFSPSCSLYG